LDQPAAPCAISLSSRPREVRRNEVPPFGGHGGRRCRFRPRYCPCRSTEGVRASSMASNAPGRPRLRDQAGWALTAGPAGINTPSDLTAVSRSGSAWGRLSLEHLVTGGTIL